MPWKRALVGGAAGTAAGLAGLMVRYAVGVARADRSWPVQVEPGLRDLGEVDEVSILPLVERLTVDGGGRALRQRTFAFAAEPLEPRGVPAHVPTAMQHSRAQVIPTTGPRVVAPGIAVLPPLPRMLFLGPIAEQAMVVNVRGFGLLLITGCGHPQIERILGVTEQVLDVPIRAVVGGLHLPVHPAGTPLIPQAVLGNPHPPWQPIGERDATHVLDEIDARGPRLVALSGHDSTPWTYDAFGRRFGDELLVSAATAASPTVGSPAPG